MSKQDPRNCKHFDNGKCYAPNTIRIIGRCGKCPIVYTSVVPCADFTPKTTTNDKEAIKECSSIKTPDEAYNEVCHYYRDKFNSLPDDVRKLGTYGDIVCTIMEAKLYLDQYGELIPPKLQRVMKERIKSQKKLAVEWFRTDNPTNQ